MTVQRFEVGMVSRDRALVDFLADVFELVELEPIDSRVGMVHRLQLPGGILKVMVPQETPKTAEDSGPFTGVTGLRYLTMRVDELDGVVGRAVSRGGRVAQGPTEFRPGAILVVLIDPDGNTYEVIQESA